MSNFLTPEAIIESLDGSFRDTMSLVDFDRKMWYASTKDKEAVDILANATGADSKALRVTKYLFEGTTRHQAVLSASSAVYTAHREHTEAFGTTGVRLVPNGALGDYMAAVDGAIAKLDVAITEFEASYTNDCAIGRNHLGALAGIAEQLYPDISELRGKFEVTYAMLPMPDQHAFGNIDQATLTRLQMKLESVMRARMQGTFADALESFSTSLKKLEARLEAKLVSLQDETAPAVRLTSSVLQTPITQAQMLRRFARGDWADKMGKVETGLEKILHVKDLAKDPEKLAKVLGMIRKLMVNLGMT